MSFMFPYPNMDVRASASAASGESIIPRSLKNLWVEIVSVWTRDDWNITAALILTLLTDIAGLLLCILEPLFSNCLGYYDSLSLDSLVSFYVICQALLLSYLFVICTNMGRYHTQITLLWIHALNVVLLLPFLIQSMVTCFPDTEMRRPLKYNKMYSGLEINLEICSNSSPNCYRKYFNAVIVVTITSVFVGIWHSLHLGFIVWERRSIKQPQSYREVTGALGSTEEESPSDINSIPVDDSSWSSVPLHAVPERSQIGSPGVAESTCWTIEPGKRHFQQQVHG